MGSIKSTRGEIAWTREVVPQALFPEVDRPADA